METPSSLQVSSSQDLPHFPKEKKSQCTETIQKVILVMSAIFCLGAVATLGTFYFTKAPPSNLMIAYLGGAGAFSGCLFLSTLLKYFSKPTFEEIENLPKNEEQRVQPKQVTVRKDEKDHRITLTIAASSQPCVSKDPIGQFTNWYTETYTEKTGEEPASEVLRNMRLTINTTLKKHWKHCSKDYPEGSLESAFAELTALSLKEERTPARLFQETMAWFKLAPFFVRLYQEMGSQREKFLPWLQPNVVEQIVQSKMILLDKEITSTLEENSLFILNCMVKLFQPFNELFQAHNFEGKDFLIPCSHRLVFRLATDLFMDEQKGIIQVLHMQEKHALKDGKENAHLFYVFNKTLLKCVFPMLSQVTLGEQKNSIKEYIDALEGISKIEINLNDYGSTDTFFEGLASFITVFTDEPLSDLSGLTKFQKLMEKISRDLLGAENQIVTKDFPRYLPFEDDKSPNAKKVQLVKDLYDIRMSLANYFETLFPDSRTEEAKKSNPRTHEQTFGDFISKSYLIAQALTEEQKLQIVQKLFDCIEQALEKGKVKVSVLYNGIEEFKKGRAYFEGRMKEGVYKKVFNFFAVQDLIAAVLFLLYGSKNFDKIHRYLNENNAILLESFEKLKLPSLKKWVYGGKEFYNENRSYIEGIGKMIGTKSVSTGSLVKIFVKNPKQSIGLAFKGITSAAKNLTSKKTESPPLKTHLTEIFIPLSFLSLTGNFGKSDDAKVALGKLEEELTTFFQALYNFDLEKMATNPEALKTRLSTVLTSPFSKN